MNQAFRPWGQVRRRYWWTAVAILIAAAHFATFDVTQQPLSTDIKYYLYFAARVAQGAVPHLDFFDNKTQLATFAGALLYRMGDVVGMRPLYAIRAGYLVIAGLGGIVLFVVHRRIANGRALPGVLGLLAYTGFVLLGLLPCIGNTPKMFVGLFGSLVPLLVHRRRFVAAGICGTLAMMDWQIGMLALFAGFAAAMCASRRRMRAVAKVALGSVLCAGPFAAYYAAHDALGAAYRQVVVTSLIRGSESMERQGLGHTVRRIIRTVDEGCDGHEWLVIIGLVGMTIYPLWIYRHRGRPVLDLLVGLSVYHYGLIAFSLLDYQRFGDLFILLHSIAFFAGVTVIEAYLMIRRLMVFGEDVPASTRGRRASASAALALGVAIMAFRPSLLRQDLRITAPNCGMEATLDAQRAVHDRYFKELCSKKAAFLGSTEQLFFAGAENCLPFVYWNTPASAYYRLTPEETPQDALYRILVAADPEIIVIDPRRPLDVRLRNRYERQMIVADNRAYVVITFARRR